MAENVRVSLPARSSSSRIARRRTALVLRALIDSTCTARAPSRGEHLCAFTPHPPALPDEGRG